MKDCTLHIDGTAYEAKVTDIDSMFFMTLLVEDMDTILKNEIGIIEGFKRLSEEQAEELARQKESLGDEEAADKVVRDVGERVIIRLNHNVNIRHQLAERLCEICPKLEEDGLVYYTSRTHLDHSREIKAKIRIGMTDLITGVFSPVIQTYDPEDLERQSNELEIAIAQETTPEPEAIEVPAQTVPPKAKATARKKSTGRGRAKAPSKALNVNGEKTYTQEEVEAMMAEREKQLQEA